MSVLGPASKVSALTAQFLEGRARGYGAGLVVSDTETGTYFHAQRSPETAHYKRPGNRITDNGHHELVYDERFLRKININKDYRFLLIEEGEEPETVLFEYLRREIPTPLIPEWKDDIYQAMLANGRTYREEDPSTKARIVELKTHVGTKRALKLRVTEEYFDALITKLYQAHDLATPFDQDTSQGPSRLDACPDLITYLDKYRPEISSPRADRSDGLA